MADSHFSGVAPSAFRALARLRNVFGRCYISGMLSREYDRFPYAPRFDPLKATGDAQTVAPAIPAPAAVADAVFSLLTK